SLAGLPADFSAPLDIGRRLVDLEVAVKERLGAVDSLDKVPITLAQLIARHLLGGEIAIRIVNQPALFLQAFLKWSRWNRLKHPDHRQGDSVFLDEPKLVGEDFLVVVVEADDEPGTDIQAGIADACQLRLHRIAANILEFLRLL